MVCKKVDFWIGSASGQCLLLLLWLHSTLELAALRKQRRCPMEELYI